MKHAFAAAFLLAGLLWGQAASAASHTLQEHLIIGANRSTLIDIRHVDGKEVGYRTIPARKHERWFILAGHNGAVPYSVTPGGSPMVPDTSMMVADLNQAGDSYLSYDSSGNLKVDINAGSVTVTFPYSGTSDGQTATAASFIGIAAFNTATGKVDRLSSDASQRLFVDIGAGSVTAKMPYTAVSGSTTGQAGTATSAVAIAAYNGATIDVLTDDANQYLNVNVQAAGVSGLSTKAQDATPVQSGARFNSSTGCPGGVLPCTWDTGIGANHTLYYFKFISGTGMPTLGIQLNCWDNTTNAGTEIITNEAFLAGQGENYGAVGRHVTTDVFCTLTDQSSGHVILTATQQVEIGSI